MADIQVEKDDKFKKLKESDREDLAKKIGDWYSTFQEKRTKQIDVAKTLSDLIYLNQADRNRGEGDEWKANIKENKIYTTADSLKSTMWKEIWSDPSQMFDVIGKTKEEDEMADAQKDAVVHALKEMESGKQFDQITDYWFTFGDLIIQTDWKTRKKIVKRPDILSPSGFRDVELPLYDNANIEAINPMFFVWDTTTYKIGDEDSWAKCIKIKKRFESLETIKSNPQYRLTKEQYDDLKSTNDTTEPTDKQSDKELIDALSYGDLKEILYLHGDFRFNGVDYKNVVAEVIERKYLIFFGENPIFICPFVWGAVDVDPETGRGISPLKCILELAMGKEELINKTADAAELTLNPTYLADENSIPQRFKGKDIKQAPGKMIEFTSLGGKIPTPIVVNANGIQEIAGYLDNVISDVSSVNSNLMGNINTADRKATELNLAQQGATSRIAYKLDKIYQFNLKVIENVAELLAMFKPDSELLLITNNGIKEEIEITSAIRQANYKYYYVDRNALIDSRQKFSEAFAMLKESGANPELAQKIDWVESLKKGLEMVGFDNPEQFFKDDTPIDQMVNQLKQLPEQAQMAVIQQVQPLVQQIMMSMQQQPAQQPMQGGM